MEIRVLQGDVTKVETEALCLGIFQGIKEPGGAAGAVDRALNGAISHLLHSGEFRGRKGETLLFPTLGRLPARRVLLVGLGQRENVSAEAVREATAAAVNAASHLAELSTVVHGAGVGGLSPQEAAQALVEGALLGLYRFRKYRREDDDEHRPTLERLQLIEVDEGKLSAIRQGAARGRTIAEAACWARDLANEPGNALTPEELAARTQALARGHEALRCGVLTERELEAEGLGGILAVARGSAQPPRLLVLEYAPRGLENESPIVLVGKGVTFDSGGISLKAREGMDAMKYDMAGAAAVLGAVKALAELKVPARVVALVPAVENLPGGDALKPGDVIQMGNGKTVEVTNTDAEGRLILADALVYARRYSPQAVVDLATLTGACIIALGKEAAGLFGNDPDLLGRIEGAAEASGERVWKLPLYDEYKELLKSEVADLKNSVLGRGALPQAGAAAGAMFLREFVEYPWAHLDIAGTAFDVETRLYCPKKGATGYGVRLLVRLIERLSTSPSANPKV